jgi:hypothetical protein
MKLPVDGKPDPGNHPGLPLLERRRRYVPDEAQIRANILRNIDFSAPDQSNFQT